MCFPPDPWRQTPADLLMSKGMVDLIAVLRGEFDYIVMDAPPLLPVVDALALATVADKILVIVEWCQTSRASIYEAFRVLGPEAKRVAGIVLNKVDFNQLPGYGAGYHYRSVAKYFSKHESAAHWVFDHIEWFQHGSLHRPSVPQPG